MNLEELGAREEIRELVASYTHLGDGGRTGELSQLFEPDAKLDAFGQLYTGQAEIADFFAGIADGTAEGPERSFIRHYISNVTIDLSGPEAASGASYWTVISDHGLESSGRYRDAYRRGPDGWRFAARKIRRDESKL